jgi:hypothetical protein
LAGLLAARHVHSASQALPAHVRTTATDDMAPGKQPARRRTGI